MNNSLNRLDELTNLIHEETDPDILVRYFDEADELAKRIYLENSNCHNETESQ